jgi:hypothetical protein
MDFGLFPGNQWQAFNEINHATSQIKSKCARIATLLKGVVSDETLLGEEAFEIMPAEGDRIADIKTPLGNGRIVLSWHVRDADLLGIMTVEREQFDKYGKQFWEPVWGLKVPINGNPYSGSQDAPVAIPLDSMSNRTRANALFEAIMAILYGIANGPVKA